MATGGEKAAKSAERQALDGGGTGAAAAAATASSSGISMGQVETMFTDLRAEIMLAMATNLGSGLERMQNSFVAGLGGAIARLEKETDATFREHEGIMDNINARLQKL